MANHKSAVKRAKQNEVKRIRNRSIKTRVKTEVGKTRLAIAETAPETASRALQSAQSIIDKASKKGVLHKNTAARKISRLYKRLNAKGV